MSKRVCPWWLGYFLASPVRRWISDDPRKLLTPYVRDGMTVLEPGPGMGFFTIPLAELVGASGRVIAVDLQAKMIAGLKRRVAKAGMADRVETRVVSAYSLAIADLAGGVDFILAFALVHEMPSSSHFFQEVGAATKSGAKLLLAEPAGHVKEPEFDSELNDAAQAGFIVVDRPSVKRSHAALLRKS